MSGNLTMYLVKLTASPNCKPFVDNTLQVCGCLWRIASDDFVFPALFEFVARVVGLSVLVGVLVFEEITPAEHTCVVEHRSDLHEIVFVNYIYIAQHSTSRLQVEHSFSA